MPIILNKKIEALIIKKQEQLLKQFEDFRVLLLSELDNIKSLNKQEKKKTIALKTVLKSQISDWRDISNFCANTSSYLTLIEKFIPNSEYRELSECFNHFTTTRKNTLQFLNDYYVAQIGYLREKIQNNNFNTTEKFTASTIDNLHEAHDQFFKQFCEARNQLVDCIESLGLVDDSKKIDDEFKSIEDELDNIAKQFHPTERESEQEIWDAIFKSQLSLVENLFFELNYYKQILESQIIVQNKKIDPHQQKFKQLIQFIILDFIKKLPIEEKLAAWDYILKMHAGLLTSLDVSKQIKQRDFYAARHRKVSNEESYIQNFAIDVQELLSQQEYYDQEFLNNLNELFDEYERSFKLYYSASEQQDFVGEFLRRLLKLKNDLFEVIRFFQFSMLNAKYNGQLTFSKETVEKASMFYDITTQCWLSSLQSNATQQSASDVSVENPNVKVTSKSHAAEQDLFPERKPANTIAAKSIKHKDDQKGRLVHKNNSEIIQDLLITHQQPKTGKKIFKSIMKGAAIGLLTLSAFVGAAAIIYFTGGAGSIFIGEMVAAGIKTLTLAGGISGLVVFSASFGAGVKVLVDFTRPDIKVDYPTAIQAQPQISDKKTERTNSNPKPISSASPTPRPSPSLSASSSNNRYLRRFFDNKSSHSRARRAFSTSEVGPSYNTSSFSSMDSGMMPASSTSLLFNSSNSQTASLDSENATHQVPNPKKH